MIPQISVDSIIFPLYLKNWLDTSYLSNNHLTQNIIFIWIIIIFPSQANPFSSGTFATSLFAHVLCNILKKVLTAQWWVPGTQIPLANCSIWLCGFPAWPVFSLKPEQTNNGLWWAHQWPCRETSPSGAWPHCDTQFASGFHFNSGPWTKALDDRSFNPKWENS